MKFEGPEKRLEVILASPQADLRSDIGGRWGKVVKSSGSKIISKVSSVNLDAYLLSESSLFVWDNRILMITCGKTTLVNALEKILDITGKSTVALVFYERKNFTFPHEQPSDFEDEAKQIMKSFPGKSYRLGPANLDHVHVFYSSNADIINEPDAVLQVFMHDLDPLIMENFCFKKFGTAGRAEKLSALNEIYPQMVTDSHLFSPFGYSLNGVFKTNYFTVHVTPQHEGSYASFETNVIEKDYLKLIAKTLSLFKPGKFSLVLTSSVEDLCIKLYSSRENVASGYNLTEKSLCRFDFGYAVTFLNCAHKSFQQKGAMT